MKIKDWVKIFADKRPLKKSVQSEYKISKNNEENLDIKVISFKSHSEVYTLLRNIKTPLYNQVFLMRGKKGFNTFLFNINFDIFVTDKNGVVLKKYSDVKPGFVSDFIEDAHFIYFSVVGTINNLRIKERDQITLRRLFIK